MPNYRRNRIPGASHFFTVNLLDRRSDLLVAQIDALREAVRTVLRRSPFHIDAWVVLPDHLHSPWTLPQSDSDFPNRWREIKTAFSKSLAATEPRSPIWSAGERAEFGSLVRLTDTHELPPQGAGTRASPARTLRQSLPV